MPAQVVSTRTDVLEKEYIDVLKDLQDNVPGFGGDRAVQIIEKELGRPISQVFDSFEKEPIAAASLGQVRARECRARAILETRRRDRMRVAASRLRLDGDSTDSRSPSCSG